MSQLGERLGMNPTDAEPLCAGPAGAENRHGLRHGRRPGCGPLWLLGYDVPRRTGQRQSVPILGTIRAGAAHGGRAAGGGLGHRRRGGAGGALLLRVTGDSMINAGIRDGDLVPCGGRTRQRTARLWPAWWTGRTPPSSASAASGTWCFSSRRTPSMSPSWSPCRIFETGAARIVGVAVRLVREL